MYTFSQPCDNNHRHEWQHTVHSFGKSGTVREEKNHIIIHSNVK